MKHNKKVTAIILIMFLAAQLIGLYVVNHYATQKVVDGEIIELNNTHQLPYGMDTANEYDEDYESNIVSIIFSFIIAIVIIMLLAKIKARIIMRTWFFVVTIVALAIALNAILPQSTYLPWMSLGIAAPAAYMKIYKRDIRIHNISELLIYPGIAAVFVPLLNLTTVLILLVAIAIYDAWAVWRSKIMQKMAKFHMDELKIFPGFLLPYANKKEKAKIKKLRKQLKEKKITKKEIEKKGIKVNVAILGGGDVVFPIIVAGVLLKTWGLAAAIFAVVGALAGLAYLMLSSKKKTAYPAMPFITTGIAVAIGIYTIIF